MKLVVIALLVLLLPLLAPAIAAAQPGPDDLGGRAPSQVAPLTADQARRVVVPGGRRKDPKVAQYASVLVTGGGLAVLALADGFAANGDRGNLGSLQTLGAIGAIAAVVGPTTGHLYAGKPWSTGLGIRLAGGAAILLGVALYVQPTGEVGEHSGLGTALIAGGVVALSAGSVVEVATAGQAAREYNREHGLDVQLTALPLRDARNATTPGLGLVGRF